MILNIIKCVIFICNFVNINVKNANEVAPFINIPLKSDSVYKSIPICAVFVLKKFIKNNTNKVIILSLN